VTLSPIVILIGLRISAAATLGPALDPWVPSSGLAASAALQSLADIHLPDSSTLSLEELTGQHVTFYNLNTRETESFFLRFDGVMSSDDEQRMTHLFRCKRTGHERKPDRGLLQILAKLADRYQGHVFEVVSAHRFNRGTSPTSKHRTGHALDVRIRGAKIKEVRSFVWKMEAPIGLGYYREQQFLHIDSRPIEGKIAWDQRTENSAYYYHPAWSGGPPRKAKAHKERPSQRKSLRSTQPQT
jgi:uncharacterized protein YcbK (DUF882 family)